MQIDIINKSYNEEISDFKIKKIKRKWDIMTLVVDGEYAVYIEGRQKPIILNKNEIALLPAGVEFEREVKSPVTYYHIAFHPQADHPLYLSAPTGRIALPKEQTEAVFKDIRRAFLLPDNTELLAHTVEHIFAENYLFGKSDKAKLKPLSSEVEAAIRYMRKNIDKKIDIDNIAAEVYLSHSGLIWKFKQELNTTPSNYLTLMRMRSAKQLLLNYSYSITEIAEMCGYSNPYYFTNSFHRYSGKSPTEFRKFYLEEKK